MKLPWRRRDKTSALDNKFVLEGQNADRSLELAKTLRAQSDQMVRDHLDLGESITVSMTRRNRP